MTDNTTPWNGIPDNPHESGWHWIGHPKRMMACEWDADNRAWGYPFAQFCADELAEGLDGYEYLGLCPPPVSRCRDGTRRVAVNAKFLRDHDMMCITMNDGTTHYFDGYYWHNGQPVFDVIGKTIPEIEAAAKQYRDPAAEGGTS